MAGQLPIRMSRSMVARGWGLAFMALLLLSGAGPAWAQAGGTLVANLERIDPTPGGAPIPAPGFATYVLKAANTSATDLARQVQVTHAFGPDALYDVTVTCQAYGNANCPAPANIDIDDGSDAGRVQISIPALPVGGGLSGNQHRLEFTIRGVVRGYPRSIGTITHRVRAVDEDGDRSTLVQIQDTLSLPADGNLRSWVTKTLDTPVPGGVPWDAELEYTLTFINDGDVPMPHPVFADHHRLRDGSPSETYTSIEPITNGSRVISCEVIGAKPAGAPPGSQGCPYRAGESWGPLENDLRSVLPRRAWNQVLYPGQSVRVRVTETINAPSCLVHDSGDVDGEGRLVLANRAYINYRTSGPDDLYEGDTGRQVVARQLPMQPLPDCNVAELKFDLKEDVTLPNPAQRTWGQSFTWDLTIQNVSDRDFGDVPVMLRNTLRSLVASNTGATIQWEVASCTPNGGATCPWSAGSLPSGGIRFGGAGVHKILFDTAGATIPQGGGLDIEIEIRAVAPTDACNVLRLRNSQWEVSLENPPSSPILDSDGNEYDAWAIIGNTGGRNNSVLGQGNDPSLIATGKAQVEYTTANPDCVGNLKLADPTVTQSVAQAPIIGGGIAYDVIVTNTEGSPAISNVELVDELADSGVDLANLDDFTLTCQAVTNGATCPDGVSPGSVICQGAACPLDGSGTAWSLLIASLPVNGSVAVRVAGDFIGTEDGAEAGEYYNTASIQAGPDADYEDENEANNFSQQSSGSTQPNGTLRLSKVLSGDDGYNPGDTFELTVTCGTFTLEPITLAAGETRDVTVLADTSCIVEETALPTPEAGYIWEAPTYAPSSTRTVPAEGVRTIEVTNTISPIPVNLQKTVGTVTEVSPGVREATYTLVATNNSSATTTYSLQDFFRPEADVTPVAGYPQASYVAGGDGLDTSVGFPRIVTDEGIAAGGVDTYQVVVRYTTADPDDAADNVCTGAVENGLFNRALLTTVGGSRESAEACADNPYRATPTIAKELVAQSGGTSDAFAEPGEQLTYRITVGNSGTVALEDVAVVDTIPANTGFVSADNGGTEAGNEVQWTVDVPAGGNTVLTVVFQVDDSVPAGVRQIVNNVTANGETCDTTPCVSTPFAEPALVVSKQLTSEDGDAAGVAEPGETLTYTITVSNTGDEVGATGASLIDITPEHTTPEVPAGSDGSVNGEGNVEWTLDVDAGQTVTRTVMFQVDDSLPAGVESIDNNVTANGAPCATVPCVSTPTAEAELVISKQLTDESGTRAGIAEPGEELTYTITLRNVSGVDVTGAEVLDPVPANTTLVSVGNGGTQDAEGASWMVDVDAGESVDLTVTFKVVESLPDGVTAIVNNVTANDQGCATTPCVSTPTPEASFTISKQLTGEGGEQAAVAEPGEALTYTVTVTNVSGVAATGVSVVDITPAHTTLSLPAGSDGSVNADGNAEWTLDIGANASVTRTVVFTVDDNLPAGVERIANNVTVNGVPCAEVPCVATPVAEPELGISKELTDEDGSQAATAEPGEQLTYTISVTNESGVAAIDVIVVDPVPANTEFVAASNEGAFADGEVQWTIPQIRAGGTVVRTVTFRVADTIAADVDQIVNNATVDGLPCAEQPCVSTPLSETELSIAKALTDESGELPGYVEPGEQLTYTITVENIGGVGATAARVEDVLPHGASFVSADAGGAFEDGAVVWTVDVAPGESVALELVMAMDDVLPSGRNAVVNNATVNGTSCNDAPCVQTPVVSPPVAVDDASGDHLTGDRAVISVLENDRVGSAALVPASVWIEDTTAAGESLTVAGEGVWSVDPQAGVVTFTPDAGFTDDPAPVNYSIGDSLGMRSNQAAITLDYVQDTVLRLSKVASARTAVIGDLLRYTLTIENVGTSNVTGATLLDVPPQGFALLPESIRVVDGDGVAHPASMAPLRVEQIDIAAGETATVTYFMAVGATALPGAHTNEAVMLLTSTASPTTASDQPKPEAAAIDTRGAISNVASATVVLESDPLFDQALILGTVFDDRDADGWQDSAEATGVTVHGLLGSGYVPGSLTVNRGSGPQPLADDAATDGLELGRLSGRSTIAEAEDANRIVVSSWVRDSNIGDGITVATAQGITMHLAPGGTLRIDRDGDAAKGLTAQDIRVQRVVTPGEDADKVDYVITNAGVQEQGIPGVRLGTIEGLLIETDAYGRYHLEGVETGHYARGSNFILKVDAATLPPGSRLTTENPRIRRITPGLPVRFDFGVQVPEEVMEGGETVEELSLGEVSFEANSAEIRPEQRPAVARMVEVLTARGGGEVEVTGNGGDPELAYARAKAVADMLDTELDESIRANTTVAVRGEVDGPEIMTLGDRIVIGEVFFDTDSDAIGSEYAGVLRDIAADIENGGIPHLLITGHADQRASDAYNLALGKRRAEAVYAVIAGHLSPQRREHLQVEYMPPTKQAPAAGQMGGQEEANR